MLKINGSALTDKGNLSGKVRDAVRAEIAGVFVKLSNGREIELEAKEANEYFAAIAGAEDTVVNAKVGLSLTVNEYTAPKKSEPKAKEKEAIEITFED